MTEKKWRDSVDPQPMLECLPDKASERKLRLLAVACGRRIWHLLPDKHSRRAIQAAEAYADGLMSVEERQSTWDAAFQVLLRSLSALSPDSTSTGRSHPLTGDEIAAWAASRAIHRSCNVTSQTWQQVRDAVLMIEGTSAAKTEAKAMASLLREIFGNPFRCVAVDPAWRTSTVICLAETIYDECRFTAVPILADALEDAGCTNQDILEHCRSGAGHVRGCWVVDQVLGKE